MSFSDVNMTKVCYEHDSCHFIRVISHVILFKISIIPLNNTLNIENYNIIKCKAINYIALIKLRLTLMVVFSAGIGFVIASNNLLAWGDLIILLISGFLITGSANGINQVIERKLDALMLRTKNRPVATNRIKPIEAIIITTIMGILGAILLGLFLNTLSAFIGMLSLIVYAFVYTPLKQKTRFSVLAGALSGAAPPLIGYTAAIGSIDELCLLLFSLQFVWQLPHFWAVAWVLDKDYKKAGFRLLPSKKGKDSQSAMCIFIATSLLIPICLFFVFSGFINLTFGALIMLFTIHFLYQAFILLKTKNINDARRLMFGSFYYLPVVQILILTGIILTT